MKNYARILSAFYFQPWNLMPSVHMHWGRILQAHIKSAQQPALPRLALPGDDEPIVGPVIIDQDGNRQPFIEQMQTGSGVAIIPVHGVLARHLGFLELWCGGWDYDHVSQMLDLAEADPSIHTAILEFNSPGGSFTGNVECAKRIAASPLKTVAYFYQACCSAAYFLASQCDEILCAPSCQTACIGSYLACLDDSREWEMEGWKLELFRSGPLKAIGIGGKEFTPQERDYLQGQADFAANQFKSHVLAKRPGIAPANMQGQVLFGEQADYEGLVDNLADTLQEVVTAAIAGAL